MWNRHPSSHRTIPLPTFLGEMSPQPTRPDREGFSVYEVWTGEGVVIAMTPRGLSGASDERSGDCSRQNAVGAWGLANAVRTAIY